MKARVLTSIKVLTKDVKEEAWFEGAAWSIDVDQDGIAYTSAGLYPDDSEIEHVQDFHSGKLCQECLDEANNPTPNDDTGVCGAGSW